MKKVNLLIIGDLVALGSIRPLKEDEEGSIMCVQSIDDYDISEAIQITGNLIVRDYVYSGLTVVTGACSAMEQLKEGVVYDDSIQSMISAMKK